MLSDVSTFPECLPPASHLTTENSLAHCCVRLESHLHNAPHRRFEQVFTRPPSKGIKRTSNRLLIRHTQALCLCNIAVRLQQGCNALLAELWQLARVMEAKSRKRRFRSNRPNNIKNLVRGALHRIHNKNAHVGIFLTRTGVSAHVSHSINGAIFKLPT